MNIVRHECHSYCEICGKDLNERIKALEGTLESIRVYLMCGAWIFNKSPDEFIREALEVNK